MVDILDSAAIISLLPSLLQKNSKKLTYQQDALAILIHTIMTILAFRLVATDDVSQPRVHDNNVLPTGWNESGPGSYTLRYRHEQSSLEFLIKISKLAGRTIINAIAMESDKTATLDISTDDFVSKTFFPHNIEEPPTTPLVHGYIGSHRIADLVIQYKLKILQKLVPGLMKEGYTEEAEGSASITSNFSPNRISQGYPEPAGPSIPLQSPIRSPYFPSRSPLEIGRRDLDPIPFQNQPNPFAPPPLFSPNSGDGMFVGPDHPIFGAQGRGHWGGDGYLPPLGAPPGARFDPVGPWQDRGPFRRTNLARPRGTGIEGPDNDEFLPPNFSDDMFS